MQPAVATQLGRQRPPTTTPVQPPAQVINLLVGTITATSIDLSWSIAPGATDYVLQYRIPPATAWTTFPDAVSAAPSGTVSGLTQNTAYQLRVYGTNSGGDGMPSAVVSATTASVAPEVPGKPVLNQPIMGQQSAALDWSVPSGAPTDYGVEFKRLADSTWSVFADGVSTTPSALVGGLLNTTAYQFRVRAQNANGWGPYSDIGSGTTTAPPSVDYFLRPGPANSPAYQKIPTSANYWPDTDASVVRLRTKVGTLYVNWFRFTLGAWKASGSDPFITVDVDPIYAGHQSTSFKRGTVTLRWPFSQGAMPDRGRSAWPLVQAGGVAAGTQTAADGFDPRVQGGGVNHAYDGHATILAEDGRTVHDFWHLYWDPNTGRYYASSYATWDIQSMDGFRINGAGCTRDFGREYPGDLSAGAPTPIAGRPKTYGWGSQRAGGCSSFPLLIRPGEIVNAAPGKGPEHALAFLVYRSNQFYGGGASWGNQTEDTRTSRQNFRSPTVRPDTAGDSIADEGLAGTSRFAHGTRFCIRRSLGTAAQNGIFSQAVTAIWYSLQEYGGYNVDQGGLPGAEIFFNVDVNASADGAALQAQGAEMQILLSKLSICEDKPVPV